MLHEQSHHRLAWIFTFLGRLSDRDSSNNVSATNYQELGLDSRTYGEWHTENSQNQIHMFTYRTIMIQRHSDPILVKTSAEFNSSVQEPAMR